MCACASRPSSKAKRRQLACHATPCCMAFRRATHRTSRKNSNQTVHLWGAGRGGGWVGGRRGGSSVGLPPACKHSAAIRSAAADQMNAVVLVVSQSCGGQRGRGMVSAMPCTVCRWPWLARARHAVAHHRLHPRTSKPFRVPHVTSRPRYPPHFACGTAVQLKQNVRSHGAKLRSTGARGWVASRARRSWRRPPACRRRRPAW